MSKRELPTVIRDLPPGIEATWEQVDPRVIERIRETIQADRWPLTFCGTVGSGKTSVAALTFASWPFGSAKWFGAAEFVRLVQTARRNGVVVLTSGEGVAEGSLWRVRIDQPSLLVIDDLGLRTPTDSQYEITYEVIERRMGKPLIISTNHTPRAIAGVYDERIASRIAAGTVVEFCCADRRPQQGRHYRVNEHQVGKRKPTTIETIAAARARRTPDVIPATVTSIQATTDPVSNRVAGGTVQRAGDRQTATAAEVRPAVTPTAMHGHQ